VATTQALAKHFEQGMKAIRDLSAAEEDTPKKPQPMAGNGAWHEMPTQPVVAD
jgi:hypothetical protein